MDAPSCYERAARAERKSALQLVITDLQIVDSEYLGSG